MADELVRFADGLALTPHNNRFVQMRKLLHTGLFGIELQKYWHPHEHHSHELVKTLVADPTNLVNAIRHHTGPVKLKMTFEYQTLPKEDPFLVLAQTVMSVFAETSQLGRWLVDIIPALCYIPDWVPGVKFKKSASEWRELHLKMIHGPYEWAKLNQDSPLLARPNFTSTMLAEYTQMSAEEENILIWSAASIFGSRFLLLSLVNAVQSLSIVTGGADTVIYWLTPIFLFSWNAFLQTVSAISTFYLAMALHPHIQIQAHQELDNVIGLRLPTLGDRLFLPYVEATMFEVLRWRPVGPLSVPHLASYNDNDMGYFIPKDSIVIANIWHYLYVTYREDMLHDPSIFPEPHKFIPERFLNSEKAKEAVKTVFGFGRRACPGQSFAELSMLTTYATALMVSLI
ncbi:hypothetical protein GYMLUDRAFT_60415 [Collybiopsis luxurians FD-317 M1]|uniref:Cytochrome P450 n=1 Tax=Collybiopsis luxurians FD-317 M1 TaxID=944289 RepID=A0A0D0CKA9_9AGAR|nr:hypothetical protein GYMLUDRAFT_60415 [Collybiopsis luxurians FD-317 M1]